MGNRYAPATALLITLTLLAAPAATADESSSSSDPLEAEVGDVVPCKAKLERDCVVDLDLKVNAGGFVVVGATATPACDRVLGRN